MCFACDDHILRTPFESGQPTASMTGLDTDSFDSFKFFVLLTIANVLAGITGGHDWIVTRN